MQTRRGAWKLILEHIVHIRVSVHYHLIAHVHLVHPEEVEPRVAARMTAARLTSGVSAASRLLTGDQTHQDRAHDHHDQHTAHNGEHFDDGYSLTRYCHNLYFTWKPKRLVCESLDSSNSEVLCDPRLTVVLQHWFK